MEVATGGSHCPSGDLLFFCKGFIVHMRRQGLPRTPVCRSHSGINRDEEDRGAHGGRNPSRAAGMQGRNVEKSDL